MHRRLTGRIPTTAGAVIITIGGLFVGILVAQAAVRALDLEGGGALALELLVLFGIAGGVYAALPDRFFTPWNGFFSRDDVEPWIAPEDRDDGRWGPDDPRHGVAAGERRDPRDDPPRDDR